MSRKPDDRQVSSRRKFLMDAAIATSGAAVAAASGTSLAEPVEPAPAKRGPEGYRETDHIRTYYDKARI